MFGEGPHSESSTISSFKKQIAERLQSPMSYTPKIMSRENRIQCNECDKSFPTKNLKQAHKQLVHQSQVTCHYREPDVAVRLQRDPRKGVFQCPRCGEEDASASFMKEHALNHCTNKRGPTLSPFTTAPLSFVRQAKPSTYANRFKVVSCTNVPTSQASLATTTPLALSFFSVAQKRFIRLMPHSPDPKHDPPTTRTQRAQIRSLFLSGCPIDEIHHHVHCDPLAVQAVISRHVARQDYDNLDDDDEYLEDPTLEFQDCSGGTNSPYINQSSSKSGELDGFSSSESLPMLQWPDSDVDMDASESHTYPGMNANTPGDHAEGEESDSDSDPDIPLASTRSWRDAHNLSAVRHSQNQPESAPGPSNEEPPVAVTASPARRTPFPRSRVSSNSSTLQATPSPLSTPSPATPSDRAGSARIPRIWNSPSSPPAGAKFDEADVVKEVITKDDISLLLKGDL